MEVALAASCLTHPVLAELGARASEQAQADGAAGDHAWPSRGEYAAAVVRAAAAVVPGRSLSRSKPCLHIADACGCTGPLDRAALRAGAGPDRGAARGAANDVRAGGGRAAQEIGGVEELQVPLGGARSARMTPSRREAAALVADGSAAPFDLERGPLIRGRLMRLAEDRACPAGDDASHRLGRLVDGSVAAGAEHAVSGVTSREQRTRCRNRRCSTPITRCGSGSGCGRGAGGASGVLAGRCWRERRRCWSCRRTGRGRRSRTTRAAQLQLALDAELTRRPESVEPAAWSDAVHDAAGRLGGAAGAATRGSTIVVIGTPMANRSRAEIEGLIGFFVNTLALRVKLTEALLVSQLLEQVKARSLEAQQNQDVPFEQVVERRDRSGAWRIVHYSR